MNWTKQKPTKDGHYWVKARGVLSGTIRPHVVHVYNKGTSVFWDGENFNISYDGFLEWSDTRIRMPGEYDLPNMSMDCPKCGPSQLPVCRCGEILQLNVIKDS